MSTTVMAGSVGFHLEPPVTGPFLGTNTLLYEAPQWAPAQAESPLSDNIASDLVTEADKPAAVVLARLRELLRQEDSDEFGVLKPTDHAFDLATRLVQEASALSSVPKGSVSTDSQGGVRITWFRADREVELVCPASPDSSPYIYHEAGSEYDLGEGASGRALARLLSWLAT